VAWQAWHLENQKSKVERKKIFILYMLYSSDDTHNKNRNATLATPRQDTSRRVRMTSIEKNHTMFFHIFPHNEGTEAKTY